MNRRLDFLIIAFLLLASGACIIGCRKTVVEAEPTTEPGTQVSCLDIVERYMSDSIGSQYLQGEVCIPCVMPVEVDESDSADVRVWGDFWVFNYNISGDTLKTVSGGDHPGLFHLVKTGTTYEVTSFDAVINGAGNLESARRIFGDKYEEYHSINSDETLREAMRTAITSDYVRKYGLNVKYYQDYGWPAVSINN